jgi:hypothetical protein
MASNTTACFGNGVKIGNKFDVDGVTINNVGWFMQNKDKKMVITAIYTAILQVVLVCKSSSKWQAKNRHLAQ